MKIWILSDLHLEVAPLREPLAIPDADVCVVAGDLCRGIANGIRWLAEHIAPSMPCVYVAGNHEFYRGSIRESLEDGQRAAQGFANIHFLEEDTVTIDGVCFLGATLWTDFRIEGHQLLAMMHAHDRMNDYKAIALQKKPWQRFVPEAAARIHDQSRVFVASALAATSLPSVVVTHHLPHRNSIAPRFVGDLLNAAYASDLDDLIAAGRPALWIHGHSHDSFDYRIHDTRVVANPRGYQNENEYFKPGLVITFDTFK